MALRALLIFALVGCDAGQPPNAQQQPQPMPKVVSAECARVAETVASWKLGNYAEPKARGPEITKQRAACEAAKLTAKETTCLLAATDEWMGAHCAPRLFPEIKIGTVSDCKAVTGKLRAYMAAQVGKAGASGLEMLDKILPVIESSCIEDGWPQSGTACILAANPSDPKGFDKCGDLFPKTLQDKLSKRMMQAIK